MGVSALLWRLAFVTPVRTPKSSTVTPERVSRPIIVRSTAFY